MANPRVSVVMPFHNAAETIVHALTSIQDQTEIRWELIAYDDGSSDASRRIIEKAAERDARIQILGGDRVGIVPALAEACSNAAAPLIARMDADDVAVPERLAAQIAYLEVQPDIALCGTGVHVTGEDIGPGRRRYEAWINGVVTHGDMVRELFVECPLPHPTFCMRKTAYEKVGGYQDHGWPEDYDLVMRFWLAGHSLGKVAKPMLEWRDRPGRLSMRDERYSETAFRALKRRYLFASYLSGEAPFYQWGAGEVGKRWLREWGRRRPLGVVDINPRKVGRTIHDVAVIAPEELPEPGTAFIVVAVGAPGARGEIRDWLRPRGYEECRDFLFLA